jgi:hypothetical protein
MKLVAGLLATLISLSAGVAWAATTRIDGPATATAPARRAAPPQPVLPPEAQPVDASHPDRVVGDGSPAGCTSEAVVDAVAAGGVITFDCGPSPVTITMAETAKVVNTSPVVVLDGGGKVTLSGAGQRRILYMNTCDPAQIWTTSHCDDQEAPQLTVQNMHLTAGNSTGDSADGGGGGAIFVRGGRLAVVNSTFTANRCDATGPDVGGGAVRVLDQSGDLPVVIAASTFGGGPGLGNACSNGGALSSIGVSWRVYDSVFSFNEAIGFGANPARAGTPGGGNGGAICLDGNRYTLDVIGTTLSDNVANEGGGGIFFVSNDRTGELRITSSTFADNTSRGFETPGYPGIFYLGAGPPQVTGSSFG